MPAGLFGVYRPFAGHRGRPVYFYILACVCISLPSEDGYFPVGLPPFVSLLQAVRLHRAITVARQT